MMGQMGLMRYENPLQQKRHWCSKTGLEKSKNELIKNERGETYRAKIEQSRFNS